MNRLPFAAALLALAFSACNSATSPPPATVTPPLLAARLAPTWISAATRLQTRDRVIYYQGTTKASPGAQSPTWSGTVSGDVLAIDAQSAILVTGGSLTIAPGGGISVVGPNQVISSDTPAWKHLLKP